MRKQCCSVGLDWTHQLYWNIIEVARLVETTNWDLRGKVLSNTVRRKIYWQISGIFDYTRLASNKWNVSPARCKGKWFNPTTHDWNWEWNHFYSYKYSVYVHVSNGCLVCHYFGKKLSTRGLLFVQHCWESLYICFRRFIFRFVTFLNQWFVCVPYTKLSIDQRGRLIS